MMYRVTDWDLHFENSRSRSVKDARWAPVPNHFDGDRISELIDVGGAEAYAGWVAVILVASRCHPRGTLVREPLNGDVRPHDAGSLARMTGLPKKCFQKTIDVALSVGLIEVCGETDSGVSVGWQLGDIALSQKEGKEGKEGNTSERSRLSWGRLSSWIDITPDHVSVWEQAYPACDIARQLSAMDAWLKANPKKAVKSNWERFITNWLTKAQDRGGDIASQSEETDDQKFERQKREREQYEHSRVRRDPQSVDGSVAKF